MKEFRLIVAGGRDFDDFKLLERTILSLANTTYDEFAVSIVSGMARGADMLGHSFAVKHNVVCYPFRADWQAKGKGAGFARNAEMGDFADGLLAFWDSRSRGTQHMISYMRGLNKPVHIVNY